MPDNPHPSVPDIDAKLELLLTGYVNVEPPAGAAERWRRTLRQPPRRDRFLGLGARAWAAACALCLAGALALAGAAWNRNTAPVPPIVFVPPPAPLSLPAAQPVPAKSGEPLPPLRMVAAVPPDARALHPTAQELLLDHLVAHQPGALTQLFAEPVFQPLTPSEDTKERGENP